MEFRTAFTTALALFGAAVAVSACELLDDEPLFCAPKLPPSQDPPQEQDPLCTECIEDHCGNAGENCSGECKEYGECTCECDEEDDACFDLCLDGKSEECRSCEDSSANELLSCVMEQCKVCLGGGPMEGGDDNADGEDTGGGMACETLHSQCCPNLEGFDLELCETATDELSCEIWLDIFQEEGSC